MHAFSRMRRLHERGPECRGLAVEAEGVMLGPECTLMRRTTAGYRRADDAEIALVTLAAFDGDERLQRLPIVLDHIAAALVHGELAKAQVLGLQLPVDELDAQQLRRLRLATDLIKAGYNQDEPRDAFGRWTSEGTDAAPVAASVAADVVGTSPLGPLGRGALSALSQLGARLTAGAGAAAGAAVAFLGIIFIPTNRSLITEGRLPDRPDVTYRYDSDTGVLSLYRNGERLSSSEAGADGIFRDSDGRAIGRKLDGSIAVDPDALPGTTATALPGGRRPDHGAAVNAAGAAVAGAAAAGARTGTRIDADTARNEPKLCPAPTEDRPGGKTEASIEYQDFTNTLSNGRPLPPGYAVSLPNPSNGGNVVFDGCRESDGTMLEAKGPVTSKCS